MWRAHEAAMIVALMALPCCHSFAMVPAGTLAPALGARPRPLRRLVISAALSEGKDVKPSDANANAAAWSSVTLRRSDEAVMEAVTEAGRQELKDLADLNKKDQEELRKKLEEVRRAFAQSASARVRDPARERTSLAVAWLSLAVTWLSAHVSDSWRRLWSAASAAEQEITLAMTGASIEMLEEYDKQTQAILESMKRDRDIIREETAQLEKLAKSMEQPLWWKKGDNAPKPGEKGSSKFSVPLALAWMFGFAGANELYQMYLNDEGVQFISAAKAVFDIFLAVVSGGIALRKKKPQ